MQGTRNANLQYYMQDADSSLLHVIDESVLAQLLAIGGDVSDFSSTTDSLEAIANSIASIPCTAMRGTDNAFLAAVGGALDDAAAAGAVTDADTAMAYLKQLVTAIILIPTTTMRGTDNASLASVLGALNDAAAAGAVTDSDTGMAYLKQLVTAIMLIPTTAMRGTDSAALASVAGALNDAGAAGAVTDSDTMMAYVKQLVTAILLIPTTAMRGTDSAALASVVGALNDAAAAGAVTDADTEMAYLKQIVTYTEGAAGQSLNVPQFAGTIAYADVAAADDTAAGTTPTTPKKTINAAIAVAGIGGAVSVKAGTYAENVVMSYLAQEFWPEIGVIIAPASGTPLTISGNYNKVWCPGGALKINPAANETGVAVTGQFCYVNDVRVACGSSADIGYFIGSAADNAEGNGSVLNNCRCASPLIAAFKLQADKLQCNWCCTGGEVADTSIGFWMLPDASGVMDKVRLTKCGSQGHATAGFQADEGCTDGVVVGCTSGAGDGEIIDNSTLFHWPDMKSISNREKHYHCYPSPDGKGVAGSPIAVGTNADDESNGAASTANYWGEPKVLMPVETTTVRWSLFGANFFCDSANKIFDIEMLRVNNRKSSAKGAGNAWDEGATVLTVADGSIFATGDLVWIYSDYKTDGEIVSVSSVATNAVTIARETSQFVGSNTGLRWNHTTNNAGTEKMYLVYRASKLGMHPMNMQVSHPSTKSSSLKMYPEARGLRSNDGLIARTTNMTDNTNGDSISMSVIYREGMS